MQSVVLCVIIGWFAIVTSDGHTASYYSTVEQVASSKVTFFLTRYDVPAYTNTTEGEGRRRDICLVFFPIFNIRFTFHVKLYAN